MDAMFLLEVIFWGFVGAMLLQLLWEEVICKIVDKIKKYAATKKRG